jgi:hypothetical protein
MEISAASITPSVVEVSQTVLLEVVVEGVQDYFLTSEGYPLRTADGAYFIPKEVS